MIQMGNQGGDGENKREVVVEWDTGCAEEFRLEGNKRTKKKLGWMSLCLFSNPYDVKWVERNTEGREIDKVR